LAVGALRVGLQARCVTWTQIRFTLSSRRPRPSVDAAPKKFRKLTLDGDEVQAWDMAWFEFDQHVEVTVWPKIVPDYRIK
jgi:hypothetical protein